MRSQDAWARAVECMARMKITEDVAERQFLIRMRDSWIEVARKLATIENGVLAQTAIRNPRRIN